MWWLLGVTSPGMGPMLMGHLNFVGVKDRMGTHPIGLIIANWQRSSIWVEVTKWTLPFSSNCEGYCHSLPFV